MKPTCPCDGSRRFPQTDYFFHAGIGEWRGYSSSWDGDDGSELRRFRNLSRDFLLEAARDRTKEMAVFAVIVVTSAWPIIYMVVTVVKLLGNESP